MKGICQEATKTAMTEFTDYGNAILAALHGNKDNIKIPERIIRRLITGKVTTDSTDKDKQTAFAIFMMPLLKICFLCYVASFVFFGMAIVFVGFGTY